MLRLIASFIHDGRTFLIDSMGQVWTQEFSKPKAKWEIVKIGDIDLDPDITEENSRL